MRRLAIALPLLLAACAQGPTLTERLNPLIGQSEGELVAALGVPVRTYDVEGRRFLQFEQRRTIPIAPDPFFYGPYGRRWGYAMGPSYALVGCDLTFALRDGRVESFTFRGQGCR
jgi:hypothetical protein